MPGRYERDFNLNFGAINKPRPVRKRRNDPLRDMMQLGATAAPALGTLAGGVIGGIAGGGAGALPGAAIGGAAGTGLGALLGGAADMQGRDADEEARRQLAEDEERAAQHNAALRLVGGL